MPKNININEVTFVANSLDGYEIEMSFREITNLMPEDDCFYYKNNGTGEPVKTKRK